MSLPTSFSVGMVNELFFRHMKELSVRSLKELREGCRRPELRLVRSFRGSFGELQSISGISRLVKA